MSSLSERGLLFCVVGKNVKYSELQEKHSHQRPRLNTSVHQCTTRIFKWEENKSKFIPVRVNIKGNIFYWDKVLFKLITAEYIQPIMRVNCKNTYQFPCYRCILSNLLADKLTSIHSFIAFGSKNLCLDVVKAIHLLLWCHLVYWTCVIRCNIGGCQ